MQYFGSLGSISSSGSLGSSSAFFFFLFLLPCARLTLVTVFCPSSADVISPFGGGFLRVLIRVGAGVAVPEGVPATAVWRKMLWRRSSRVILIASLGFGSTLCAFGVGM